MEDLVEHERAERDAAVHRAAEHTDANDAQDRRDERCVRYPRETVITPGSCNTTQHGQEMSSL